MADPVNGGACRSGRLSGRRCQTGNVAESVNVGEVGLTRVSAARTRRDPRWRVASLQVREEAAVLG